MEHPLGGALRAAGITQEQLSALVRKLRLRRSNGRPLRLSQAAISEICRFKRGCSGENAEAIVLALRGKTKLTAAEIVFAKAPAACNRRKQAA